MATAIYVNKGTTVLVNGEAGAAVAFSMEGVANGAGRVSAQHDLGVDPRPYRFSWSCEVMWQATPTQGAALELYVAGAPDGDSSQIDGDIGASDAALGDAGRGAACGRHLLLRRTSFRPRRTRDRLLLPLTPPAVGRQVVHS